MLCLLCWLYLLVQLCIPLCTLWLWLMVVALVLGLPQLHFMAFILSSLQLLWLYLKLPLLALSRMLWLLCVLCNLGASLWRGLDGLQQYSTARFSLSIDRALTGLPS